MSLLNLEFLSHETVTIFHSPNRYIHPIHFELVKIQKIIIEKKV